MSYSAIDHSIQAWAAAKKISLFTEWAGAETRSGYLWNSSGECYQIVIDAPENDLVRIHVWAVETLDDVEAHLEWHVSIAEFEATLLLAEKTIRDFLWRRPLRRKSKTRFWSFFRF